MKATSDYKEILKDEAVDLVMITTRHNLHASMVLDALQAEKHVFVEKPSTTTLADTNDLISIASKKELVLH